MKNLVISVLLATALGPGAFAEKYRQCSENGGPLFLRIQASRVTRETQSIGQQTGVALSSDAFNSAIAGGGTYRGPLNPTYDFKQLSPPDGETFVIVRAEITGILKHKLVCASSDFVLVTQSGARFFPIGKALERDGYWLSVEPSSLNPAPGVLLLVPKQVNVITWIFETPSNSASGATLQLVDAKVQLPSY